MLLSNEPCNELLREKERSETIVLISFADKSSFVTEIRKSKLEPSKYFGPVPYWVCCIKKKCVKDVKFPFWFWHNFVPKTNCQLGSGCDSVGRAVASNTRGPRFESSHRQNFYWKIVYYQLYWKDKINKKRPGMAHFKKKKTKLHIELMQWFR